jgi:hypothetical protein
MTGIDERKSNMAKQMSWTSSFHYYAIVKQHLKPYNALSKENDYIGSNDKTNNDRIKNKKHFNELCYLNYCVCTIAKHGLIECCNTTNIKDGGINKLRSRKPYSIDSE